MVSRRSYSYARGPSVDTNAYPDPSTGFNSDWGRIVWREACGWGSNFTKRPFIRFAIGYVALLYRISNCGRSLLEMWTSDTKNKLKNDERKRRRLDVYPSMRCGANLEEFIIGLFKKSLISTY